MYKTSGHQWTVMCIITGTVWLQVFRVYKIVNRWHKLLICFRYYTQYNRTHYWTMRIIHLKGTLSVCCPHLYPINFQISGNQWTSILPHDSFSDGMLWYRMITSPILLSILFPCSEFQIWWILISNNSDHS